MSTERTTKLPVSRRVLEELIETMRGAASAGLLPLTQGNMSLRDDSSGLMVVTPHDLPYDQVEVADIVVLDLDGGIVSGTREPSSDAVIHRTIYRARDEVKAVLHTEPVHVNAMGVVGETMPPLTTLGLKSLRAPVPIMPFRAVRDEAFALEMLACMGSGTTVVWRNHGLLVCGASSDEVLRRSIGIEYNAQVMCLVRASGGRPQTLRYGESGVPEVAVASEASSRGEENPA